ncbi:SLATT domain-containing protein [Streptomyces sp. WAC00263]|uniref:SLATT domain-containing protein n=1 Tax=Streptomyces sp. WAC00263 TaxID=1917422 RepID=UPI00240FA973|nr:SLATT domain-containing protein [Streptomyces sp. WAC00263]
MRRLRRQPLRVRQHAYLEGRLVAEHAWYTAKARRFTRIARRWTTVAFIATLLGLAGGFVRAFGLLNYDGLGSASAIAAAATAWVQLKQYRPLAAAYSLTSHELLLVKAGLETLGDDEAQWSRHCSEAEEAISREHTMWLARREAA